jgi:putative ABC transport system ATP-binding protein
VDLTIRMGELMMLVGPSGCGKTTLISVIAGILDRDAGRGKCEVFGRDFDTMSGRERTKLRGETVGFVFQQFNLLPALTTTQNVAVPMLINGVGQAEATRRAQEVLVKVGLKDKLKSMPRDLSGGQQQRVAIARALVNEPALILADEPTGALDSETSAEVMQLLDALNRQGITVILVTHEADMAAWARRRLLFKDGRLVADENNRNNRDLTPISGEAA